jgi:hypothetical protein
MQWREEHGNRREKHSSKYYQNKGQYERYWGAAIYQEDGDTEEIFRRCVVVSNLPTSNSCNNDDFLIKKN